MITDALRPYACLITKLGNGLLTVTVIGVLVSLLGYLVAGTVAFTRHKDYGTASLFAFMFVVAVSMLLLILGVYLRYN